MDHPLTHLYATFDGHRRIGEGSLAANAMLVKHAVQDGALGPVLIFDNASGRSIDVDIRGSDDEVVARLVSAPSLQNPLAPVRLNHRCRPIQTPLARLERPRRLAVGVARNWALCRAK